MEEKGYKRLVAWQKAMALAEEVYQLTRFLPNSERYGLASQMQRSAVSIPSNIAEGSARGSRREFRKFLLVSFGSGAELETQLNLTARLGYGNGTCNRASKLLDDVMRLLNRLIHSVEERAAAEGSTINGERPTGTND